MKRWLIALALVCAGLTASASAAQAAGLEIGARLGVGVGTQVGGGAGIKIGIGSNVGIGFASGGVNLQVGTVAFRQRFIPVGQVWVNEPYIYWQTIADPFTGRLVRVQRIGYTRRLTVLYLDTWQGGYGYFDRWGNPIPWNSRFPW